MFEKAALLQTKPAGNGSGDCTAASADGKDVAMRPFMTIEDESYSAYVQVKA